MTHIGPECRKKHGLVVAQAIHIVCNQFDEINAQEDEREAYKNAMDEHNTDAPQVQLTLL